MFTYHSFLKNQISNIDYHAILDLIEHNDDYQITDISFNEEKKAFRFYILINSTDKTKSYQLYLNLLDSLPNPEQSKTARDLVKSIVFHENNNDIHFIRISHLSIEVRDKIIVYKPYFTIDENIKINDDQIKFRCLKILFEPLKSKFMNKFLIGDVWRNYHIQFGYNILNNEIISQKLYCEIPGKKFVSRSLHELNTELQTIYNYSKYKSNADNFIEFFDEAIPVIAKSGFSSHLFSLETSTTGNHFRHYFTPNIQNKDNLILYQNLYENNFITKSQFNNLHSDASDKMEKGFKIYDVGLTFKNGELRVTNTYNI